MTPRALTKLLGPLRRAVNLMVGRAVVTLVNDALKMQGMQITLLADEVRDKVERVQNYGFTSHPKAGAEAVVVAVGGSRNQVVIIACDDRRYRLTGLEEGEVALYDDLGSKIVLKRGNVIEVTAAVKVSVVSPLVEMSGHALVAQTLTVAGQIIGQGGMAVSGGAGSTFAGGTLTHDGVNVGKTHVHGGVQTGGGNTGGPQ